MKLLSVTLVAVLSMFSLVCRAEMPQVSGQVSQQVPTPPTEATQLVAPQAEAPQVEAPQAEAPQAVAPQVEAPQAVVPEVKVPQVVAPKVDAAPAGDVNQGAKKKPAAKQKPMQLGMQEYQPYTSPHNIVDVGGTLTIGQKPDAKGRQFPGQGQGQAPQPERTRSGSGGVRPLFN